MQYAVRRHLGMSWEEWEALPWHQARTYLEGLVEEFSEEDEPGGDWYGGPSVQDIN